MVSKVDEFKSYVIALDDDEIAAVINALRYIGNDDLACEVEEEAFGECGDCDCGDMPHDDFMSELRSDLVDCVEETTASNLATLILDIDTSSLEVATEKLKELADAAERAADVYERLECLNNSFRDERGHYLDLLQGFLKMKGKE